MLGTINMVKSIRLVRSSRSWVGVYNCCFTNEHTDKLSSNDVTFYTHRLVLLSALGRETPLQQFMKRALIGQRARNMWLLSAQS